MKTCTKCHKEKEKSEFYGRAANCKSCHCSYYKLRRANRKKKTTVTNNGYGWWDDLWQ